MTTTDLVERLRDNSRWLTQDVRRKAADALLALQTERDELEASVKLAKAAWDAAHSQAMENGAAALLAQSRLEAAERDARRYRWLRVEENAWSIFSEGADTYNNPADMDRDIDTALARDSTQGETT